VNAILRVRIRLPIGNFRKILLRSCMQLKLRCKLQDSTQIFCSMSPFFFLPRTRECTAASEPNNVTESRGSSECEMTLKHIHCLGSSKLDSTWKGTYPEMCSNGRTYSSSPRHSRLPARHTPEVTHKHCVPWYQAGGCRLHAFTHPISVARHCMQE
jgi:hypothetical protein